ncbi:MAG: glycosyltransferase family 4 protein [Lentisphaeria bacterium]|nr:glycosyltransferase family 4 protein [Lentisphaeria bacterium]
MRILLSIFRYFPTGGLQKDALRIAMAACRAGHEVVFLTTRWEGETPACPRLEIRLTPPLHAWSNMAKMAEFSRLVAQERSHGYDSELAMNRIPGAKFYFAGDECMAKAVSRKHCWLARTLFPRYRALLAQEKATLLSPETRKVLVISQRQIQDFQEVYGLPAEHFVLLPPDMDGGSLPPTEESRRQELRRQERQALGLSDDTILLLAVSSSFQLKGVDRALLAMAHLPAERRRQCHFVLIGRNDPAKFHALAQKCGLSPEEVTALPPRDSVGGLYLAADLMLHPARSEGAGSVLVEAIANGLPVICTAVCGFAPIIAPAGNPVLPEPFNQPDLDLALLRSLDTLPARKAATRAFGDQNDFCGRAPFVVKLLEDKAP